jgi:hypothetical protein
MRILLISILTIWAYGLTAQCDFYEDITGLSISGATAGDNTQEYVLVNAIGNIQAINSMPDFMGLSAGDYEIYAINYEGILPTEIAVGLVWAGTSAITSCYDASDPYLANVCENVVFPTPITPCEFIEDITGLSVSGAEAGDNIQEYVLVNSTGNIQAIATTPDFTGLTAGDYWIYAINYVGTLPTVVTVGGLWSATTGITSCFDASDAYATNVCDNVVVLPPLPPVTVPCEFTDDITGLSISGETTGDNTQQYLLIDATENIVDISSTADFTGLTAGDYWVVAINYEGTLPTEIAIGNSWAGTGTITSCYDASDPYPANVCESVVVPPDPTIPCEFVDDITGLTIAGATAGDNIQEYVLVSTETGNIVQISSVTDFFNLDGGDYQVYAINYEGTRPVEITVGSLWSATMGISSCFDASDAYVTNVCESLCENEDLIVSSTGFNSTGSFSQTYILVDTNTDQVVSTNTTGTFDAALYAANEELVMYALNTDDAVLLASITTGADWLVLEADIATACADIIGPRSISVLIITDAACCNDTTKGFVR